MEKFTFCGGISKGSKGLIPFQIFTMKFYCKRSLNLKIVNYFLKKIFVIDA